MLLVERIRTSYDEVPALHEVSFRVEPGQIVSIVGANGAGKSTILKSVSSVLPLDEGSITFENQRIDQMPAHRVVDLGIAHVPEGRRLFARLTVRQNLILGAYTRKSQGHRESTLKKIFKIFPVLQERQKQAAGTLSGGEQQMLAIARGLMSKPKLLMLDEPSLGIMPKLITEIFEMIQQVNKEEGLTILLVEQNVQEALEIAHYAYVLQTGRVMMEGKPADLLQTDTIRKAYLGL
ncbi:MAG TPA: ABC transporter ATP-binding protein [Thermodesulfobacteriota bacterium]|nr:ABC transporter ATP-binding protein [Thermodesulfobacteriota bacterium]